MRCFRYPCHFNHSFDDNPTMEAEIIKLKELLSVHLDMLEDQMSRFSARESQIKLLRHQNEKLLQKMERMESHLVDSRRTHTVDAACQVSLDESPGHSTSVSVSGGASTATEAMSAVDAAQRACSTQTSPQIIVSRCSEQWQEREAAVCLSSSCGGGELATTSSVSTLSAGGRCLRARAGVKRDLCAEPSEAVDSPDKKRSPPAPVSCGVDLHQQRPVRACRTSCTPSVPAKCDVPHSASSGRNNNNVLMPCRTLKGRVDRASDEGRHREQESPVAAVVRSSGDRHMSVDLPAPQETSCAHADTACLWTAWPYHSSCDQQCWSASSMLSCLTTDTSSTSQQQQYLIEIPRWQLNSLSAIVSGVSSGHHHTHSHTDTHTPSHLTDEDICDDAFVRRHAKLEADEKRRKRWDVQRLRQQRFHETLSSSYVRRNSGWSAADDTTASSSAGRTEGASVDADASLSPPTADETTLLAITDQLPVCVFGVTWRHVEAKPFCLPWTPSKNPPPAECPQ